MSADTATRRRAAVSYLGRGISVIPVPSREKNPNRSGWQDERLTAADVPRCWTNGQNVGLLTGEPSAGRVDADLDADEAVAVAGRFLLPTLTSGRERRPHSHWWYVCPDAESKDWKDTDGAKLVELRATGRQTLVWPSTHPSGDGYLWHAGGVREPVEVGARELEGRLRELATAALVARHLPPPRDPRSNGGGGRHDYALALAGFLLRSGRLDEGLLLKILRAAWDAKGWPDEGAKREAHRDLEGIVRDTAGSMASGRPVVGGPTLEESVPGVVRLLCKWWGWNRTEQRGGVAGEKEDKRNQADRLIGYALENLEGLFVDQHGAPHALVDGEPLPLTSRCYSWLRRLMWEREERAVNGEYLKTAAGTLAAHAEFSGEVRELHTRAAWHTGTLYYELRPGRVVQVRGDGWGFAGDPPVLFRRYPNLKPLPDPVRDGSAKDLAGYANLKTSRDKRLFTAYAATVPLEHVGRPILNASGAMGSGKTSVGRLVKRTWDPTAPETVRLDPRDVLQKASHAFVLMLDNQNAIPEWAADTLCRLVTGEADSKRRLYTDDEDVIIELRRAVLLNGINAPTDRGDVLDRSLVVELERIPDAERKTEEELWERFGREHPRILGALFGVLSEAMAIKPSLKLSRRPRLADWGEYAAAVYEVMGWGAETFLTDWDEVVKVQNRSTLDGSPVAQAVIRLMEDRAAYEGTSTELHKELEAVAEDLGISVLRDKEWPKSARWLWKKMQVIVPLLVTAGIEAGRSVKKRGTIITLRKTSTGNATGATGPGNVTSKPDMDGGTASSDATANATDEFDATANTIANPADGAVGGNSGNSGISFGDFSEVPAPTREFLSEPPGWLQKQMDHCRRQGCPASQLKALAASVAAELYGSATRGAEILLEVEAFMTHGVGCDCGVCR